MSKVRVHELAKEFDIPSKDMVTKMQTMGLDVKNHMSTVETSQADWVRRKLSPNPPSGKGSSTNAPERQTGRSPVRNPRGDVSPGANSGDDKTRNDRAYQDRSPLRPEHSTSVDKDKTSPSDQHDRRPQGQPGQGYGDRRPQGQPGQGYGDRPQGQPGHGVGGARPKAGR